MRILSAIFGFFTSRLFLTLVGITALCLLVWFLGPRIEIGTTKPLVDEIPRLTVMAAIVMFWLLTELIRRWRLRWLNRRMIESLAESRTLSTLADDQNKEEAELIRQRFERALEVLQSRTVSGETGGRYLYNLPWYVLIGPPGAGKTTVLSNSGLDFPLAEELGVEMIEGFGGTRTCDWWFTEDAVFIDTAGRYTTQNINPEGDRAAWQSFLDILKTHRERRPVNGIVVSIGLDSLLGGDADGANAAEAIKARIQELMNTFRTRLPIYVFVNKCDLISGFREFFDDLSPEERNQVFGATLTPDKAGTSSRSLQDFSEEFDDLVERLTKRLLMRLDEERRPDARRTLFAFPQQMAGLKRPLERFLSDVFRPSRYTTQPLLRGVYFTSGTQEGIPVDGLMSAHASAYDLAPGLGKPQETAGNSYFINRILRDVVFPEQHLAGADRRVERRLAMYHVGAYAALLLVSCVLIGGWHFSVQGANTHINGFSQQIDAFEAKRDEYQKNRNIKTAIETIVELEPGREFDSWPDMVDTVVHSFGLLAPTHIEPRMHLAFEGAADDVLIPAMTGEIGNELTDAMRRNADPALIRNLLSLYVGIGDQGLFDRDKLETWVLEETKQIYPLEPKQQELAIRAFGHAFDAWPGPQTIDQSLVEQARNRLFSIPPASQVYAELKGAAFQSGIPPLSMQTVLGIQNSQYFVYRRAAGERAPTVPNLYTADGFYNLFLKRAPALIAKAEQEDPLSGRPGSKTSESSKKVIAEVTKNYTRDYIANWNAFIDGIGLRDLRNVQDANNVLETLASNTSPLTTLLNAVTDNTVLPLSRAIDPNAAPSQSSSDGSGPLGVLSSLTGSAPAQAATGTAAAAASGQTGNAASSAAHQELSQLGPFSSWPGSAIEEPFDPLHNLVVSRNNQPPGIGDVQQSIVNLYSSINLVATAPDIGKAAFDEVKNRINDPRKSTISAVAVEAVSQPSPVHEILTDLSQQTWTVLLGAAQTYLNDQWKKSVVPECRRAIFQRYPAHRDAKDETTVTDFANFFAPSGTMTTFFTTYLEPFVDTSSTPWTTRQVDGKGLNISPDTLQAFADAKIIADAFFANNAPTPTVSFTLRPSFLDASAARVAIDASGDIFTYRHEPPRDLQLTWPSKSGSDKVSITLTDLKGASSSFSTSGPWAWFRLFDHFGLKATGLDDQYELTAELKSMTARFQLNASSVNNPFDLPALTQFRCRGDL